MNRRFVTLCNKWTCAVFQFHALPPSSWCYKFCKTHEELDMVIVTSRIWYTHGTPPVSVDITNFVTLMKMWTCSTLCLKFCNRKWMCAVFQYLSEHFECPRMHEKVDMFIIIFWISYEVFKSMLQKIKPGWWICKSLSHV